MSFAVQSKNAEHLGFLLLAGGPNSGDCIFRSLPFESGNFDIPESEYLYELQLKGEFHWTKSDDQSYRINSPDGELVAELEGNEMTSGGYSYLVIQLGDK